MKTKRIMKINADSIKAGRNILAKSAKDWTEAEAVLMFMELRNNLHRIKFGEIPKPDRIRIIGRSVVCDKLEGRKIVRRFILAKIQTAPDGKRDFLFATMNDGGIARPEEGERI